MARFITKTIQITSNASLAGTIPVYMEFTDSDLGGFADNVNSIWFSSSPDIPSGDTAENVLPFDWDTMSISGGVLTFKGWIKPTNIQSLITIYAFATNDPTFAIDPNYVLRDETTQTWSDAYQRVYHFHDARDAVNDEQRLIGYGTPSYVSSTGVYDGRGAALFNDNGYFYDDSLAPPGYGAAIEFFFKPGSLTPSSEYTLVLAEMASAIAYRIALIPEITPNYYRINSTDSNGVTYLSNSFYMNPSTYHHIGIHVLTANTYIWVDGESRLSRASTTVIDSNMRLKFGGALSGSGFVGHIDEARILLSEATPSQIFVHNSYNAQYYVPTLGTASIHAVTYNIIPSGGIKCNGSASPLFKFSEIATNGISVTGEAESINFLTATFEGGVFLPFIHTLIEWEIGGVWYTDGLRYNEIAEGGITCVSSDEVPGWICYNNIITSGGIKIGGNAYDNYGNMKIVRKAGTVASSIDILEGSPAGGVPWYATSYALANDMTAAHATFTTSAISECLYIRGFGFNLSDVMISGIDITIYRGGVGNTKDYHIGLVYKEGDVLKTTLGLQSSEKWVIRGDGIREVAYYGDMSERWNKTWTTAEVNDPDFGILIAAQGDLGSQDQARVDYVEVAIYYARKFDSIDPCNFTCGGSAEVQGRYNGLPANRGAFWIGGVHCFSKTTHIIYVEGGMSVGGAADVAYSKPISGDTFAGGEANDDYLCQPLITTPNFRASGSAEIFMIDYEEFSVSLRATGDSIVENFYQVEGSAGFTGVSLVTYRANTETSGGARLNSNASVFPFIAEGGLSVGSECELKYEPALIIPEGMVRASGTAIIKVTMTIAHEGGVNASGEAYDYRLVQEFPVAVGVKTTAELESAVVSPYFEFTSGGVTLPSEEIDVNPKVMMGGCQVSGLASVFTITDQSPNINKIVVFASGDQMVPPQDSQHNAGCIFELDLEFKKLKFWIWHDIVGIDAARIRKGARGVVWDGATVYQIEEGYPLDSPIVGGIPFFIELTNQEIAEIQAGLWHIMIRDDLPVGGNNSIRAQIVAVTGCRTGGTAEIVSLVPCQTDGGIKISGEVRQFKINNPSATSVIKFNGNASVHYNNAASSIPIRGTCKIGGTASYGRTYISYSSSGIQVNGLAANSAIWVQSGSAGVKCDALVLLAIAPHLEYGGVVNTGVAHQSWIAEPPTSGGILTQGLAFPWFIDYFEASDRSPVRIAGSSSIARIKYTPNPIRVGWGRALVSDNLFDQVVRTGLIIPPSHRQQAPALAENRVRTELIGQWCSCDESCRVGCLPKVQQNRQSPYLPPKYGRITPRDRGIARQT